MGFASSRRQDDGSVNPIPSASSYPSDSQPPSVGNLNGRQPGWRRSYRFVARSLTFLVALLLAVGGASYGFLRPHDGVAVCVTTLMLLLALAVPTSRTREWPLALPAPVLFGALLWFGTGTAVWSALLAHLLAMCIAFPSVHLSRNQLRFQGGQLALAALGAGTVLQRIVGYAGFSLLSPAAARFNYTASLYLLRGASLGALAFLIVCLILTLGVSYGGAPQGIRLILRRQLTVTLPVYVIGLLPWVLLAPLGATVGIVAGLPAILLLVVSMQTVWLRGEATGLRGQLNIALAMGRASVMDASATEPGDLLERFLLLAQELVRAEQSAVWILDTEKGELRSAVERPNRSQSVRRVLHYGDGLIGHAATRLRPRLIHDAAQDPHRGQHEAASGAWLLYPIVVRDQVLGVAQWTRPANQPFSPEDIARLDSLVPQAAIALENIRIRARMHDLAATDGLTGLWNQRKMADLLRDELRRAQRYHRVLSILMLDVDSFKTFNDTYGHPQGDHLLRSIAAILRSNVRVVDQVGRYGGEEFLIVLPETSKDDACRLAERLRSAVQERGYTTADGETVYRTLSVGVAAYPEDALNPIELVQRADEALYRAKRAGKNRVIWA